MNLLASKINQFTEQIMSWHQQTNMRQMPWKGEKDPYRIWLSEIILQQTRVEQGWKYYMDFTTSFPDVVALANAPNDVVFKKWEGLGYYSRCSNLLATARKIRDDYNGNFPADYTSLLSLKGVGPYTAAAIASFAFGLPEAVVDGNVVRVLARFFGINEAFDQTAGRKIFQNLAHQTLYLLDPAAYNQAIMDFGATVCKPMAPLCTQCPLAKSCFAWKQDRVDLLPVKAKKIQKKNRYFTFFILTHQHQYWVIRRSGKDIWNHLYTFLLQEHTDSTDFEVFLPTAFSKEREWIIREITSDILLPRQALTHQWIHTRMVQVHLQKKPVNLPEEGVWVDNRELKTLAFPRTLKKFIIENWQE
jgi:A/G-specific adenine glycosylase